ncbi:MAG: histidine phosphatase family protein [Chlorogloeopsis fritschii C42_A2020_084]|uniref:histidine phosphatase family protein n=1 Tax=Chlorogloeopsis fritschii TaxID=1124 RepID=UPI001A0788A3|nr:histidine phosphatase family protein [Chlorogloeopsis fritschii]MBF2003990.1 histidine phosphatase family protein [Chlorogloeopsis fritschii C42_A2020_084]
MQSEHDHKGLGIGDWGLGREVGEGEMGGGGENLSPHPLNQSDLTRVILVRHAQSTYNAQKRYQGSCNDSVLTEKGRNDAYQTGVALRGWKVDKVYTSPLLRTIETTLEILDGLQERYKRILLPHIDSSPLLQEIDMPAWQGLTYKYVQEHFAEDYRCWKERPHEFQMAQPQQEKQLETGGIAVAKQCFPVLDLYDRARQFWREILPLHIGKTILIVSHGGTIRALIGTAIAMGCEQYHVLQQSNCGISILKFPTLDDQRAQLEAMNLTTHLGEVLPKLKDGKQGLRLLLVPANEKAPHSIHKLTEHLQTVPIDFSLSSDLDYSQQTAKQLLKYHPKAVELQVLRQDFLQLWQQTLLSERTVIPSNETYSARPITALVVASVYIIQNMLAQVLGTSLECLQLVPNTLSILYYPLTMRTPVLQAMNIVESLVSG